AAVHGATVAGAAVHGATVTGAAVHGATVTGAAVHGAAVARAAVQGAAVAGAAVPGAAVAGAAVKGAAVAGAAVQGAAVAGAAVHGPSIDGHRGELGGAEVRDASIADLHGDSARRRRGAGGRDHVDARGRVDAPAAGVSGGHRPGRARSVRVRRGGGIEVRHAHGGCS